MGKLHILLHCVLLTTILHDSSLQFVKCRTKQVENRTPVLVCGISKRFHNYGFREIPPAPLCTCACTQLSELYVCPTVVNVSSRLGEFSILHPMRPVCCALVSQYSLTQLICQECQK